MILDIIGLEILELLEVLEFLELLEFMYDICCHDVEYHCNRNFRNLRIFRTLKFLESLEFF